MTTNDKRPPRTTKARKAAKTPPDPNAPASIRTAGTGTAGTGTASIGPASAGAAHAPSSAASAGVEKAAGAMKAAGALRGAGVAKASRPAKLGNDAASPAGAESVDSPAIKAINVSVTPRYREDRHASIAKAAYFRSESRGFAPGHEVEDWLAAEEEVDQRLLGEGRAS